jgi:predicted amidohydrolase
MERYVAVAIQNQVTCCTKRSEVMANVEHCMRLIDTDARFFERMLGFPMRLVVLPEYCFSDWRGVTAPWWEAEVDPLEVCIEIPGPETDVIAAKAREHGIYIAAHALELKPEFPGYFFNCGFIVGPDGSIVYTRNKVEHAGFLMYASPHDVLDEYMAHYSNGRSVGETLYPVVETDIGRLGMAMCYEMIVPELHRQLVANGAEVMLRPTAEVEMFQQAPTDVSQVLDRARAIENVAYYVTAQLGPSTVSAASHHWSGSSRVIDYNGSIIAQARTTGETLVGGVIDVDRLRAVRAVGQTYVAKSVPVDGRRRLPLYRPDTYDYLTQASYPSNLWRERPQSRQEKWDLIKQLGEPGE